MNLRTAALSIALSIAAVLPAARLDFVVSFAFPDSQKPPTQAALTLTTTVQNATGASLGDSKTTTVTWQGKETQAFAVFLTVSDPLAVATVSHTLTYTAAGGGGVTLSSGLQPVLAVPFAAHAENADAGLGGNFTNINPDATVTADTLQVSRLSGITNTTPDVETQTLAGLQDLEISGNLAADHLTVGGNVTLSGNGDLLPAGLCTGLGIVPEGTIIAWANASITPGEGWVLCDGNNGTPNLNGVFPVGAAPDHATYRPKATGGADTVALSTTAIPSHSHAYSVRIPRNEKYHYYSVTLKSGGSVWGRGSNDSNATTSAAGKTIAHENRPPYFTVRFFMKKGAAQ